MLLPVVLFLLSRFKIILDEGTANLNSAQELVMIGVFSELLTFPIIQLLKFHILTKFVGSYTVINEDFNVSSVLRQVT